MDERPNDEPLITVTLTAKQAKYLREMLGDREQTNLDRQAIAALGPAFAADMAAMKTAIDAAMAAPVHPAVRLAMLPDDPCPRCHGSGYSRYRVGINPFDLGELETCRMCDGAGVDPHSRKHREGLFDADR